MSTNNEDPLAFLKAEPERPAAGRPKNELSLVARPYGDDRVFRIDRIPMPWITIIAVNLLCVALCYGLHWFLKHAGGDANVRSIVDPAVFAYVFPPALALFLCVGLAALSFYFYGGKPWLVYHKATRRVELPRHKVSFDRPEIVRLEYIVHASLGHRSNDLRWSEPDKVTWSLYLVTCRDGRLQQWSLLKSPYIPLDYLLPPLTRQTDLPVVRIALHRDPGTGATVKEMPATPYATGELPAGSFAAAAAAVESADGSFATAAPVGAPSPSSAVAGWKTRYRASQQAANKARTTIRLAGWGLFALAWMAAGIYLFFAFPAGAARYRREVAMIANGQLKPQTLYVVWIEHFTGGRGSHPYDLYLSKSPQRGIDREVCRDVYELEDLKIGTPVTAYQFADHWLIPRFDGLRGWEPNKWVILLIGLLPLSVLAGVLWFRRRRRTRA